MVKHKNGHIIPFPKKWNTHIDPSPAEHLGVKNTYCMLGKGLARDSMRQLEERFRQAGETESELRDRALYFVLSRSGLRSAELLGLKFSDIVHSPEGEPLVQVRLKGGQFGLTCLSEEIIERVRDYHDFAGIESDHFFLTLPLKNLGNKRQPLGGRALRRIVNSWGGLTLNGRQIHSHAIRHTVSERLFQEYGAEAAQKVLHHKSPETTKRYYSRAYHSGLLKLDW